MSYKDYKSAEWMYICADPKNPTWVAEARKRVWVDPVERFDEAVDILYSKYLCEKHAMAE